MSDNAHENTGNTNAVDERFAVRPEERVYLRELAKRYREYGQDPQNEQLRRRWFAHNAAGGGRPLIVMEHSSFIGDLLPAARCTTAGGRRIEQRLQVELVNAELVKDDKVFPAFYPVYRHIHKQKFGLDLTRRHAADAEGRTIGYADDHVIVDLARDRQKLGPSRFHFDAVATAAERAVAEDVLGDLVPVVERNNTLHWHLAPSQTIVDLMGLEAMMLAMIDTPELMHELYSFVREDQRAFVAWQEAEGLLMLNNDNDYAGAGSYGFTDELPAADYRPGTPLRARDLWGNVNSQETVGVSPEMYCEFVYPHYEIMARDFGLVYYGCCEPVHDIWEPCLSRLPNLRKVSISAWCNEPFMGEALRGSRVIYSRKPSPNYIGVGVDLDEEAFAKHILTTVQAARGCALEIIFRDIYTLTGRRAKAGRAVEITRRVVEEHWRA